MKRAIIQERIENGDFKGNDYRKSQGDDWRWRPAKKRVKAGRATRARLTESQKVPRKVKQAQRAAESRKAD